MKIENMSKPKIYIASKVKYAPLWLRLRSEGLDIISTWINEAGEGESQDLADLAIRCIEEPKQADYTILYCKENDFLKFAIAEVGSALSAGKKVIIVGDCASVSSTMAKHPNITRVGLIEDAIIEISKHESVL